MKKTIAVLFGGVSSEHDISIITAQQAIRALNKNKYDAVPVYIDKTGIWYTGEALLDLATFTHFDLLKKRLKQVVFFAGSDFLHTKTKNKIKKLCRIDCALVCMHGAGGEDGCVQGLLELCNIAYTSSGVLGSSLCMDKVVTKRLFEGLKLPILPWFWTMRSDKENDFLQVNEKIGQGFGYPVIVKPANLGSSIGISICKGKKQLKDALEVAFSYDNKIIIEKALTDFKEVNCAVLGLFENIRTSTLEEPIHYTEFLNFESKYMQAGQKNTKGGMASLRRIMPANVTSEQEKLIRQICEQVFVETACSGVVRIDFLLDLEDNQIYINEINTIPGSLSFYLWKPEGLEFYQLIDELISLAQEKKIEKQKNTYLFDSGVLLNFAGNSKISK